MLNLTTTSSHKHFIHTFLFKATKRRRRFELQQQLMWKKTSKKSGKTKTKTKNSRNNIFCCNCKEEMPVKCFSTLSCFLFLHLFSFHFFCFLLFQDLPTTCDKFFQAKFTFICFTRVNSSKFNVFVTFFCKEIPQNLA